MQSTVSGIVTVVHVTNLILQAVQDHLLPGAKRGRGQGATPRTWQVAYGTRPASQGARASESTCEGLSDRDSLVSSGLSRLVTVHETGSLALGKLPLNF